MDTVPDFGLSAPALTIQVKIAAIVPNVAGSKPSRFEHDPVEFSYPYDELSIITGRDPYELIQEGITRSLLDMLRQVANKSGQDCESGQKTDANEQQSNPPEIPQPIITLMTQLKLEPIDQDELVTLTAPVKLEPVDQPEFVTPVFHDLPGSSSQEPLLVPIRDPIAIPRVETSPAELPKPTPPAPPAPAPNKRAPRGQLVVAASIPNPVRARSGLRKYRSWCHFCDKEVWNSHKYVHKPGQFSCKYCGMVYGRPDNLRIHHLAKHPNIPWVDRRIRRNPRA